MDCFAGGSKEANPSLSAIKKGYLCWYPFLVLKNSGGIRIRSEQTSVCVFADRRKNSPVDCFAGGSKEANPSLSANKKGTFVQDGLLMVPLAGVASLEPPAKQSTGLFFRLSANTQTLFARS